MRAGPHRIFPALGLVVAALGVPDSTKALAQGTVYFANHVPTSVISRVFLPLPRSPGLVQIGNGTADYPPGTTDWTGWTPVSGAGYSAQLFAAAGANVPIDSLAPALPVTI